MEELANIDGRLYPVADLHELAEISPCLAQHMKARGFDAYGYVKFPRGGNAIVYRHAASRVWHVVVRVR